MMTRLAAPCANPANRPGRRLVGTSLLTLVFVAAACGGDDADDADFAGQPGGVQAEGAATGVASDRMQLTLSEGPFTGTHDVSGDMGCFSQPGIWGAGLSRLGDPGISEFMLLVQGVPASGGSSEQVEFTITFGDVMADETGENSGLVGISSASGGGSGTATVTREGRGATIEVTGTSNHRTPLNAVIRCADVEVIQ
jgi:hypothetical protein